MASDALDGVTPERAREIVAAARKSAVRGMVGTVAGIDSQARLALPPNDMLALLALAARGAETVGATEAWCTQYRDEVFGGIQTTERPDSLVDTSGHPVAARRVLILRSEP